MRFFLLLLLSPFLLFSQNMEFDGYVVDAQTNAPIPYVNISFLDSQIGTSSDENGHFFLDIPIEYLKKEVHVSSLGYKDIVRKGGEIFDSKLIRMEETNFELEEVVVTKVLDDSQVLNAIGGNHVTSGFNSSSTPWILALYFPNEGSADKFVEKITVFFGKGGHRKISNPKFRLRLFNVDPVHKIPKEDLVIKSLILEREHDQNHVSIDLSKLRLRLPDGGMYVGLEWLFVPSNWYKRVEKDKITGDEIWEDRFAPTFGGIYTKDDSYKFMIYGMGAWNEFTVTSISNTERLVPAISLKISK